MTSSSFEKLHVYRLSERLADTIWQIVATWDWFARDTLGKQIVRSADSVGANIAEGIGRWSYRDNRRFVRTARGSLFETRHWLRRAHRRQLLTPLQVASIEPILNELIPRINAYIRSIGSSGREIKEPAASYTVRRKWFRPHGSANTHRLTSDF